MEVRIDISIPNLNTDQIRRGSRLATILGGNVSFGASAVALLVENDVRTHNGVATF